MKGIAMSLAVLFLMGISSIETMAKDSGAAQVTGVSVDTVDDDGIYIFFTLTVQNMKGQNIRAMIWLSDNDTGGLVQARPESDPTYQDLNGNLTTQEELAPCCDETLYESLSLYIPYSSFPYGTTNWHPMFQIQDSGGNNLMDNDGHFDSHSFETTIPGSSGYDCPDISTDSDCDGATNSQELWIAQNFMPVYEFDEEEHDILQGTDGISEFNDVIFLYQVSRVTCWVTEFDDEYTLIVTDPSSNFEDYLLTVVATYEYDYVPYDPVWDSEEDLFAHYGDTERVQLCIEVEADGSSTSVLAIQINRHEEADVYVPDDLEWDSGGRVHLYVSEGKHGTYISHDECENAVSGIQWVGWDEDCSDGRVIYPTVNQGLNIGEFANQQVWASDLGDSRVSNLFPGEAIWSLNADDKEHIESRFCGGYDVPQAPGEHTVISPDIYTAPWCAGSLTSKWYQ
jgi:hypothetical protein